MKKTILFTLLFLLHHVLFAQNDNYAEVNGVKLYYETLGEGHPLVLLHYLTGTHNAWDEWKDSLSQDYQLIIPDLRGHGESTNPSGKFRHDDSAKDVYALMDELGINEFKAMGMSSGGMTLIHMATMDSTRISSMILIGATTQFGNQARARMKDKKFENISEARLEHLRSIHPNGDEQITMIYDQWREMSFVYDDMNFTPPYLSQIKCPTLIIHGDRDDFFPVDIPVESYKAIPNSSLWIIPSGGHLPIWGLWSDQFLKVSKRYLKGEL